MMPTATIESAMIRVDRDVEVPLTRRQQAPESAQLMVDNGSRSAGRQRQAASGQKQAFEGRTLQTFARQQHLAKRSFDEYCYSHSADSCIETTVREGEQSQSSDVNSSMPVSMVNVWEVGMRVRDR